MTAQGYPRAIFKRAIERGNVVAAEATAREIGLSLEEALQLVLLYAAYEPAKLERAALRWLIAREQVASPRSRAAHEATRRGRGVRRAGHGRAATCPRSLAVALHAADMELADGELGGVGAVAVEITTPLPGLTFGFRFRVLGNEEPRRLPVYGGEDREAAATR